MANPHPRRGSRKPEKEEVPEEEEEEEGEEELLVEEKEGEAVEGKTGDAEEKTLEVQGTFSEEYFWKMMDIDDSSDENSKAFLPRLTSITSPSLSPTPTFSGTLWSETPILSSHSSVSSQKSTSPARPFL